MLYHPVLYSNCLCYRRLKTWSKNKNRQKLHITVDQSVTDGKETEGLEIKTGCFSLTFSFSEFCFQYRLISSPMVFIKQQNILMPVLVTFTLHDHSPSAKSSHSVGCGTWHAQDPSVYSWPVCRENALFVLTILQYGNGLFTAQNSSCCYFQLDLDQWDLFFSASITSISKNLTEDACCFYVRCIDSE